MPQSSMELEDWKDLGLDLAVHTGVDYVWITVPVCESGTVLRVKNHVKAVL